MHKLGDCYLTMLASERDSAHPPQKGCIVWLGCVTVMITALASQSRAADDPRAPSRLNDALQAGRLHAALHECLKITKRKPSDATTLAIGNAIWAGFGYSNSEDFRKSLDTPMPAADRMRLIDVLLTHSLGLTECASGPARNASGLKTRLSLTSHAMAKHAMEQSWKAFENEGVLRHQAVKDNMSKIISRLCGLGGTWERWDAPDKLALDLAFAANSGSTEKDKEGIINAVKEWYSKRWGTNVRLDLSTAERQEDADRTREECLRAVVNSYLRGAGVAEEELDSISKIPMVGTLSTNPDMARDNARFNQSTKDFMRELARDPSFNKRHLMEEAFSLVVTVRLGKFDLTSYVKKRGEDLREYPSVLPVVDTFQGPMRYVKDQPRGTWDGSSRRLGTQLISSIGMELEFIPAGRFVMGSPSYVPWAPNNEKPEHWVEISRPFWLGVHEVSQQEYQRVMGVNPSSFKAAHGQLPVDTVSWDDAQAFCKALSDLPEERAAGRVYRLPTEAEWEYACRADGTFDPVDSDEFWYDRNSDGGTHPVGQMRPNGWFLFDMPGNVSEWCEDWYDGRYYSPEDVVDPSGPKSGTMRVSRGGSWGTERKLCLSTARDAALPSARDSRHGFRVALVPKQANASAIDILRMGGN